MEWCDKLRRVWNGIALRLGIRKRERAKTNPSGIVFTGLGALHILISAPVDHPCLVGMTMRKDFSNNSYPHHIASRGRGSSLFHNDQGFHVTALSNEGCL
ncbi:unnamed protein product [Dovyalis caffra]|uniref:Uncharacterized protein n=1 Tax=Dovyalis caffra TaxID=77055 RepID=A0AAV1SC80_9ROSI|nr:unnamed protein product [Dovyalis caffra]